MWTVNHGIVVRHYVQIQQLMQIKQKYHDWDYGWRLLRGHMLACEIK